MRESNDELAFKNELDKAPMLELLASIRESNDAEEAIKLPLKAEIDALKDALVFKKLLDSVPILELFANILELNDADVLM
jgi:hypothetical protein